MKKLHVLVACEFSGIVREAFRKKGHDAWSCDLLDTEIPGQHIKGDVLEILNDGWDLIIAHPPCTYLANSGVRWMTVEKYKNEEFINELVEDRYKKMINACKFFNIFQRKAIKVAIENPIPHKYAIEYIGKYNQIIQPWQFGHPETKATCLWLKNLPLLKPTNIVEGREGRVWKEPPGPERWKNRSRTYQGIADAMASQWSEFI